MQVHWHEGLFLQPHHLQMEQRALHDRLAVERRLAWPYAYGVIEQELSTSALRNFVVQYDRLRAVMPGGLEVDVPHNADLPAVEIKRALQQSSKGELKVFLGVPLYQASRANTVDIMASASRARPADDARVKRLWRVSEANRADDNTGENTQAVLVRRINARLVIEGDDTTDLEVLPLMQVTLGTGEEGGLPRRNAKFFPPCLTVGGSGDLRYLLRELAQLAEATRKDLIFEINREGYSIENLKGPMIYRLLRLSALNRAAARLPSLLSAGGSHGGGVSPFDAYLELRSLLGDLAAVHPDRDPWEVARYDHDNPSVAFWELDAKLRELLGGVMKGKYKRLQFEKDPSGVLSATVPEDLMREAREFFLAIRSKEDPTVIARLVEDPDTFKLMPKSMAKMVILGVKLQEERHPPSELPSESGLYYFRLNKAETRPQIWDRIVQERSLSVRWAETEKANVGEVWLYATIP